LKINLTFPHFSLISFLVSSKQHNMKKYQLIMIGYNTGNPINFGTFDTVDAAMQRAKESDGKLFCSPYVKEVIVLQ